MTLAAPSPRPVSITIPADYLEDVRTAVIAEIENDGNALRSANAEDRRSSELILRRSTQLLKPLLEATGGVELQAEQDTTSSPLVHALEALVRMLSERLRAAAQYGPIPMGDVADLAAEMRWAAEEAIRIDPGMATRLTWDDGRAVA
jgi:hypothetical protein